MFVNSDFSDLLRIFNDHIVRRSKRLMMLKLFTIEGWRTVAEAI